MNEFEKQKLVLEYCMDYVADCWVSVRSLCEHLKDKVSEQDIKEILIQLNEERKVVYPSPSASQITGKYEKINYGMGDDEFIFIPDKNK